MHLALDLSLSSRVMSGGSPTWWPAGALAAADFNLGRYMLNGAEVAFSALFAAPASPNLVTRNGRQCLQIVSTLYRWHADLLSAIGNSATVIVEGDAIAPATQDRRIIAGTYPVAILVGASDFNDCAVGAWNGAQYFQSTSQDQIGRAGRVILGAKWDATPMRRLSINGNVPVGDANGFGSFTNLYLGGDNNGNYATGYYDRVAWYADAVTDAELQRLTTTPLRGIVGWGDSLLIGLPALVGNGLDPDVSFYDLGVGGNTTTDLKTRFDAAAPERRARPAVFLIGRNDGAGMPTTGLANIAAMIASLGHSKYLILSTLTGGTEGVGTGAYNLITAFNAQLAASYGSRYRDIRAVLVAAYNPGAPQDVTDHANDTVPTSLRSDTLHLNATGRQVVADYLTPIIQALGWY